MPIKKPKNIPIRAFRQDMDGRVVREMSGARVPSEAAGLLRGGRMICGHQTSFGDHHALALELPDATDERLDACFQRFAVFPADQKTITNFGPNGHDKVHVRSGESPLSQALYRVLRRAEASHCRCSQAKCPSRSSGLYGSGRVSRWPVRWPSVQPVEDQHHGRFLASRAKAHSH
jgi:hypothetical protein